MSMVRSRLQLEASKRQANTVMVSAEWRMESGMAGRRRGLALR